MPGDDMARSGFDEFYDPDHVHGDPDSEWARLGRKEPIAAPPATASASASTSASPTPVSSSSKQSLEEEAAHAVSPTVAAEAGGGRAGSALARMLSRLQTGRRRLGAPEPATTATAASAAAAAAAAVVEAAPQAPRSPTAPLAARSPASPKSPKSPQLRSVQRPSVPKAKTSPAPSSPSSPCSPQRPVQQQRQQQRGQRDSLGEAPRDPDSARRLLLLDKPPGKLGRSLSPAASPTRGAALRRLSSPRKTPPHSPPGRRRWAATVSLRLHTAWAPGAPPALAAARLYWRSSGSNTPADSDSDSWERVPLLERDPGSSLGSPLKSAGAVEAKAGNGNSNSNNSSSGSSVLAMVRVLRAGKPLPATAEAVRAAPALLGLAAAEARQARRRPQSGRRPGTGKGAPAPELWCAGAGTGAVNLQLSLSALMHVLPGAAAADPTRLQVSCFCLISLSL
jgi:hypothetical protein